MCDAKYTYSWSTYRRWLVEGASGTVIGVAHSSSDHRALGAAIRNLRKKEGLAQEELAHRSGLHRTYMGDVERGERNLGFANLTKVCTGLGVTLTELATEYDRQRKTK